MSSARDVWELSRAVLADKDGMVAVLRTYMDESGTHDNSPVVTVGAYVGKPDVWRDWTKDWNKAKRQVPQGRKPIDVYHSNNANSRTEEFDGWTKQERNEFCSRLLPIFAKHSIVGCAIGIHLETFNAAMAQRPELMVLFGTPYTACFQWVVQTILNNMDAYRDNQRIAFFHENNDYMEEATKAFRWIERTRPPGSNKISLTFGAKGSYAPLQAADVVAYEANHVLRDPDKPRRPSWNAIDPDGSHISLKHYGRKNMGTLIDVLSMRRAQLLASGWDGQVE